MTTVKFTFQLDPVAYISKEVSTCCTIDRQLNDFLENLSGFVYTQVSLDPWTSYVNFIVQYESLLLKNNQALIEAIHTLISKNYKIFDFHRIID